MDATSCTPQDMLSNTVHCLSREEVSSITLLVVTGMASMSAVLVVPVLVVKNLIRERRRGSGKRVFRQPMDVYMLSLLLADLFHSLGSLFNIKWIDEGKSDIGLFCTVQGLFNQIGPVAVALNTILIAVVTFIAIWWRKGVPIMGRDTGYRLCVAVVVTLSLWLLVGAIVAIPAIIHRKAADRYWAPTPLWCTIGKNYELERLWAKYLWLWIAFLVSIVLYIPLAFWAWGNITIDDHVWWKFRVHATRIDPEDRNWNRRRVFFSMITYPLSNAILIIPLSIVRWIQNTGSTRITSADSIAVAIIFDLSGLTNVLLLLYIRPSLLLLEKDEIHCACCSVAGERVNANELVLIQGRLPGNL